MIHEWFLIDSWFLWGDTTGTPRPHTRTPPGPHQDPTRTPPGHHRDTTGTPPGHHRDTTGTPPGHYRDTTGTPPGHYRDTTRSLSEIYENNIWGHPLCVFTGPSSSCVDPGIVRDGSCPALGGLFRAQEGGLDRRFSTEPGSRLSANKRKNVSETLY